MLYVNLFLVMFIPAIMWLCGWMMHGIAQGKPNRMVGYRTKRSMQSQEMWMYANQYCGALWMKWSLPVIVISLLLFSLVHTIEWSGTVISCVQILFLFVSIGKTENALKRRKQKESERTIEK